jgi:hypothetical protein
MRNISGAETERTMRRTSTYHQEQLQTIKILEELEAAEVY